jgi:hypothetical protein
VQELEKHTTSRIMATVGSLTEPLILSLSTASILCADIRKNRHCGSIHTQLDLLETSLLDGSSDLASQCSGMEGLAVSETVQEEFQTYTAQLALIGGRLDSIAHPSHTSHDTHETRHHSHHKHEQRTHSSHSGSSSDEKGIKHHHEYHSNAKPLMFLAFQPIHHHHHKAVEDPHFHEIREVWEGVRRGIYATLNGLKKGGKVEEMIVQKSEKVDMKKEGGVVEEVIEKTQKVDVKEEGERVEADKELDKTQIRNEGGKAEMVEEAKIVEIKQDERKKEVVKEEIKHVKAKERDIIVVEVDQEHHKRHEDDISPLDSGNESESENEDRQILKYELKEVEVKA